MMENMKSVNNVFLRTLGDVLPPSEEKQLGKLHALINSGNLQAVEAFLKEHPDCDLSKKGDEGYTALQLAVLKKNVDMLVLLLQFDSKGVVDALNLAVELGFDEAFSQLLIFLQKNEGDQWKTSIKRKISNKQTGSEENEHALEANLISDDAPKAMPFWNAPSLPMYSDNVPVIDNTLGRLKLNRTSLPSPSEHDESETVPNGKNSETYGWDFDRRPSSCMYCFKRSPSPSPVDTTFTCSINELMKEGVHCWKLHGYEPLIRAAKAGNFRATTCLLKAGCTIPEPHKPSCECISCCVERLRDPLDPLKCSHDRLETYRALASPIYIMLTAPDPILTAIERASDLKKMSFFYPENMGDYKEISTQCANLAVDLLAQCHKSCEVKQLLTQSEGSGKKSLKYGRLQLAVRLKQKQFIAHPTCQDVLAVLWLEGLPSWKMWSVIHRLFYVIFQVAVMPFLCFLYILAPKAEENRLQAPSFRKTPPPNTEMPCKQRPRPKWVRMLAKLVVPVKVPLNRFVYASASYCCFLALLLVSIVDNNEIKLRLPCTIMWYDWPITVWILAFIYKLVRDVHWSRSRSFWSSWWILYELLMMGFLIAALICLFVANAYYTFGDAPEAEIYQNLLPLFLLGEGFYGVGCTLAFMRVLQWLHLSQHLGVIIISFSRMSAVIFRLLLVFIIVLFAFSSGIHVLYKDFQVNETDGNGSEEAGFFRSYKNTLRALFWAIFGHGESKYADIPDHFQRNLPENDTSQVTRTDYLVTEVVGHVLWGSFHIAFVVVMLNMVIAVMTHNFEEIQENCDVEWKFARTKLWMYYFEDHNAVPPPFNLLYLLRKVVVKLLKVIYLFLKKLFCCCCRKRKEISDSTDKGEIQMTKINCDLESSPNDSDDENYKMLTKELVNRLLHQKNIKTSGTLK